MKLEERKHQFFLSNLLCHTNKMNLYMLNIKQKTDKIGFGLAFFSGILLTASFPNFELSYLAWISIIPMFYAVYKLDSLGKSPFSYFRIGWIFGMTHFITLMYWLVHAMSQYGQLSFFISIPLLLLLCSYLSIYPGLFFLFIRHFYSRPILWIFLPVLWVGIEYFRSLSQFALPWEFLGYTQYRNIKLIQAADIFGVYGISFLIIMVNYFVFLFYIYFIKKDKDFFPQFKSRIIKIGTLVILMTGAMLIYGDIKIKQVDEMISNEKNLNVAVIQGNIDQDQKWDKSFRISTTKKYIDLSLQTKTTKPDLIVWPETAMPFYFEYGKDLKENVENTAKNLKSCLLTGGLGFSNSQGSQNYYNSAFLINKKGILSDVYSKVHLVPFGEYVPFQEYLPFIGILVEGVGGFSPGEKGSTLSCDNIKFGTLICFEIIFPDLSRLMTLNGSKILVNITNDAWYGRSSAPFQHFSMVVFRAVENKRPIARSANTGISGFIDPLGRIMSQTQLFVDKAISQKIPTSNIETTYTKYGDVFARLCFIISIGILIWIFIGYIQVIKWKNYN